MSAVATRMAELMTDVAIAAEAWRSQAGNPGSREESDAHEDLVQAILAYADEYRGFEQIMQALHPSTRDNREGD